MQSFELDDRLWDDSWGKVLTLISEEECRELVAGICTFQPGQRVPQEGFTSHAGAELSLMLAGELVIGTNDEERVIRNGELLLLERGIPHYSENRTSIEAKLIWVIAPAIPL